MNKERRKRIEVAIGALQEIQAEIETLRDDEEEAYNNMPDALQQGERGEAMEVAISNLEGALNNVEEAISSLENTAE